MSLGEQIYTYRKQAKMTQQDLADELDISFQTVSSWERDEYVPEVKRLVSLAEALQTSVGKLLEEHELPEMTRKDRYFDEGHMYTFLKGKLKDLGLAQSLKALPFARDKHKGQFRKGGDVPYIHHPLTMACSALAMGLQSDDLIASILLHDVLEDCDATVTDLPVGENVKKVVMLLTFEAPRRDRKKARAEYFQRINAEPMAQLVKCIDRVNNLSTMVMGFSPEQMAEYILETEQYVFPMLNDIRNNPEWNNAAWLLSYQMQSLTESCKRML